MKNNRLSFLKIEIINHPLFKKKVSFSLVASQRVFTDEHFDLTHLFGNIWINNITTLIGRNASGKTLSMKLVMGMLSLLLHQRSIDQTHLKETLIGTSPISFNTYFYGSDHVIYLDKIVLKPKADQSGQWSVDSEIILEKNATQNMSRKALFDFTSAKVFIDRQQLDNLQLSLLADDDSLMRTVFASNEYTTQPIFDTLMFTNTNVPFINPSESKISQALLRYLDPTIDYLYIENKDNQAFYRLKFNNSEKEITDSNFATIEYYLSSGTVKGITLYQYIVAALRSGGLIFIDELENHFNLAIVRTFMAYFTNPKINPNRAVLIFSTHYADLIDDLSRGDQIFVSRRQDSEIAIDRYSDIADRQDINRAEIFMSNYLGGTAPDYDAYMELLQQLQS
ncbi:AAA family ATPase [Secundilactobacillus kimchicus]|uniref:AAA family ATPase n=1 Tax=Secundilactobacillus kimchicus TaxID=528209 RepID=UPI001C0298D4|nr:AAA family ATPase [Secundilactobacillus kimchicus]MBT9671654.1 AAA family ATPase [Secundilactobacillus kimchicus]